MPIGGVRAFVAANKVLMFLLETIDTVWGRSAFNHMLTDTSFLPYQMCAGSQLLPGTYVDVDMCFVACSTDEAPGTYFSFESRGRCFCYNGPGQCNLTENVPIRGRALQTGPPIVYTYRIIVPAPRPSNVRRGVL